MLGKSKISLSPLWREEEEGSLPESAGTCAVRGLKVLGLGGSQRKPAQPPSRLQPGLSSVAAVEMAKSHRRALEGLAFCSQRARGQGERSQLRGAEKGKQLQPEGDAAGLRTPPAPRPGLRCRCALATRL